MERIEDPTLVVMELVHLLKKKQFVVGGRVEVVGSVWSDGEWLGEWEEGAGKVGEKTGPVTMSIQTWGR
nr:hypothetical protein [Tanacetum cinerariifolium]